MDLKQRNGNKGGDGNGDDVDEIDGDPVPVTPEVGDNGGTRADGKPQQDENPRSAAEKPESKRSTEAKGGSGKSGNAKSADSDSGKPATPTTTTTHGGSSRPQRSSTQKQNK